MIYLLIYYVVVRIFTLFHKEGYSTTTDDKIINIERYSVWI